MLSPAPVLGNYNITSNTANFTINKKDASVTPAAKSKTYGSADPALTGVLSGFLPADGVSANHEPLADAGESQVVMSDFHYERATCVEVVERAHGDVLVAGLGLGMILHPILGKESVRSVTVIEKYQDVVDLVLPTLPASEKLTVLLDDIYTWKPPQAHSYDVIWFDIWPDIEVNRLSEMARLHRRFWRYLNRTNPECWMESWHRQETQRIARRRRNAKKDNPQSPLLQAAESA